MCSENEEPHDGQDAREANQAWREALTEVRYTEDRIAIRLGEDHPVHHAFVECMRNLEARRGLAWAYERGVDAEDALASQSAAHASYNDLRWAYVQACKALLATDA